MQWSSVVVALAMGWSVSAGALAQPPARATLVNIAVDSSLPFDTRNQAMADLSQLPEAERYQALRDIVSRATDVAPEAARVLASELSRTPESVPFLAETVAGWDDPVSQSSVLGVLLYEAPADNAKVIARAVMERMRAAGAVPCDPDGSAECSVDFAALILAQELTAADLALVRDLLAIQPLSRGLWLSRASASGTARTLAQDEREHAQSVWSNDALPLPTRIAAAVAASGDDEAAAQFVRQSVGATVAEFGPRTQGELVSAAQGDAAARTTLTGFMSTQRSTIAMLRYYAANDAETLLRQALQATNEAIRETAALVVADRFPSFLLEGRGGLTEEQHARLLGMIVERNPALAPQAEQLIGAAPLADARAHYVAKGRQGLSLGWATANGL